MSDTTTGTIARNATLEDIASLLEADQLRKVNVVTSASKLAMANGNLVVTGVDPVLGEDGVTDPNGIYRPTWDCDTSIATRLDIPAGYLRRMRTAHPRLLDDNVNGWLHHDTMAGSKFMLRAFTANEGPGGNGVGVGRALLSDRYMIIDHLDVLASALDGVREAGVNVVVDGCDLTDRRMYVRLLAPEVIAYAPKWLERYRDPRTGELGRDNAAVQAGLLITNSETGHGAASVAPWIRVLVCKNGQTRTHEAVERVHVGSRLPEGIVQWSQDTRDAELGLLRKATRDAVRTFLNVDYMQRVVAEIEAKAGVPVIEPEQTIEAVASRLKYSEAQRKDILRHFIMGADLTAGGVMQAVTSAAQDAQPDMRFQMESDAFNALSYAAAR